MANSNTEAVKEVLVNRQEAIDFAIRTLTSPNVGAKAEHARAIGECLIGGDYRGHFSHGLQRLEMYVLDIQKGVTAVDGEPAIERETAATALVDGHNLLGPVVGNFAMQLAIQKAQSAGIGWVVAHHSNHYGIAGWYSMQALEKGLIGISMTNTSPLMAPTRGKKGLLGTNPLAVAAPAENGQSFFLDMATSAVALGKVEMKRRKGEKMPHGWGADKDGHETLEPAEMINGGTVMPLGGVEESSGYKGYGLAMMVEMFCGILAGAQFGPNIRRWMNTDRNADLGQCFACINPEAFAPGFQHRMQTLMDLARNSEPADPSHPVLVPGDPERENMRQVDERGGILYHPNVIGSLDQLATRLNVKPIARLS